MPGQLRCPGTLAGIALLLLGIAAPLLSDPPARPEAGVEPVAILAGSARVYGSLRSFQVRVRTEVPVQPEPLRVMQPPEWRDNRLLGPLSSGVWVKEHDYRIARGQAVRCRSAQVGCAGTARTFLRDRMLWADYTNGLQVEAPRLEPFARIKFADGKRYVGLAMDATAGMNLPLAFFLVGDPGPVVAARSVALAGREARGGRGFYLLKIEAARTVLQDSAG